ncbi:MAG: hypothetical protein AB1756_05325 [Acidobacteriota bacterium]
MKKRSIRIAVLFLMILSLVAFVFAARKEKLSPKYSRFTFKEQTETTILLINIELARFHAGDDYFPILFALGNSGDAGLPVNAENFTLIDERGKNHPVVPLSEIKEKYRQLESDKARLDGIFFPEGMVFDLYYRAYLNLYPATTEGVSIDKITLRKFEWVKDLLYFKRPEKFLGRILTLRYQSKSLEKPIEVRFMIERSID